MSASIDACDRNQRERVGNVPAQPDVLAAVPQHVGERADDRLAVADQRVAGVALQRPVAEQRHQAGQEQAVGGAHDAGAADRLLHHARVVLVEQRHEERAELRVVDVRERRRALDAARRPRRRGRRRSAGAAPPPPPSASAASPLLASAVAAATATRGSGSSRWRRISADASSCASTASARSAAARTSTSSSCAIRSIAGVHFLAMRDRVEASAISARRRTRGDSCCSSSGVIRWRLSSASSIVIA